MFNKSRVYQQVEHFHQVFGHPTHQHQVTNTDSESLRVLRGRLDFIAEEFFELLTSILGPEQVKPVEEAYQQNIQVTPGSPKDAVEFTDALADLVFLIYGTAATYGIPLDDALDEVYASNMSKLGADGKPIYRDGDGKILKGPHYAPPRIRDVLNTGGALYQPQPGTTPGKETPGE